MPTPNDTAAPLVHANADRGRGDQIGDRISERRDVTGRAARDQLGLILHIDPRNLVRVAGVEAVSMVAGILAERARNHPGGAPQVWRARFVGMKRVVVAVDAYLRRPASLFSKDRPSGRQPSRTEDRPVTNSIISKGVSDGVVVHQPLERPQ